LPIGLREILKAFMPILIVFLILLSTAFISCGSRVNQPSTAFSTVIDLTYPFDKHTIYWPNNLQFHREDTHQGMTAKGYWYASGQFAASEHGGTHMDAPIHFAASGLSVDQIPVKQLIGPAVVIDIRKACQNNPDYVLTMEDIKNWETTHGQIPPHSLVLLFTGWGQYWPDQQRYLGSHTPQDSSTLHFPGFSEGATHFLVQHRRIRGVGIDTASIDTGQSTDFPAHRILGEANAYALENVANLDQIPTLGSTLVALPMKIRGGTGGPVRLIALLP
jgi:kynurenine formamidase